MTRVYLPTFAELIDRLTIVQLKSIFIHENKVEYDKEIALIMHDIDLIISEKDFKLNARGVHAILMIAISNLYIWVNESKARQGGDESDKLLKLTHSINGSRNTAKNVVSILAGDRRDFKIDCFSASLIGDYGNWNVWRDDK